MLKLLKKEGPETRIFKVVYAPPSVIVLKVLGDRVQRTLLLHEPRSYDQARALRIRLPDGKLPGDEYLEEHRDGVMIQWAREDADAFLECRPLPHALEADEWDGGYLKVAPNTPAPHVPTTPAHAPKAPEAPPPAPPFQGGEPPVEARRQPTAAADAPSARPQDVVRGVVVFAGIREHSHNGRAYHCYTVDVRTPTGMIETRRGSDLEDRMRFAGAGQGDTVEIKFYGRDGRKNKYYVRKL